MTENEDREIITLIREGQQKARADSISIDVSFYFISLVFSYFIITDGNLYFAWWLIVAVPIFALWLNAPLFLSNNNDKKEFIYVIFGYLIWVGIQWIIYYFGLGPPEGVGVPHF